MPTASALFTPPADPTPARTTTTRAGPLSMATQGALLEQVRDGAARAIDKRRKAMANAPPRT